MNILKLMAAALLSGIVAHVTHRPTRRMGPKYGLLTRYAIGTIIVAVYQALIGAELPKPETKTERIQTAAVASSLSALSLGAGVFLAHEFGLFGDD